MPPAWPMSIYQPIRRSPGTKSKCLSRLSNGNLCWRAIAAIRASFAGIDWPVCFRSRHTLAYSLAFPESAGNIRICVKTSANHFSYRSLCRDCPMP